MGIIWRVWAKAIGEKAHKSDHVADKVAMVRTFIFLTYLITNVFIVAGVLRHWNDQTEVFVEIHTAEPVVPNIRTISNPRVFE